MNRFRCAPHNATTLADPTAFGRPNPRLILHERPRRPHKHAPTHRKKEEASALRPARARYALHSDTQHDRPTSPIVSLFVRRFKHLMSGSYAAAGGGGLVIRGWRHRRRTRYGGLGTKEIRTCDQR